MQIIAAEECEKRGFDGWRLARGETLLRPHYLNAAVQSVRS
jgi:hypothetical protein